MTLKSTKLLWLASVLVATALTGAVPAAAQAAPGSTLTLGTADAVPTLNPTQLGTGIGWNWLISLGYDSLLWFEPDGTYTGNLATEWGFADNNTRFDITLRPDVTFQDGTPLDAEAVAASLNYAFGNPAARAALYAPGYKSAAAVAPLEVSIKCDPACPSMEWLLTQNLQMGSIISPAGLADPEQIGTQMFGSGPYILNAAESVSGDSYVFDANPNYWNQDAIHYDRVVLRSIADSAARLTALQTGQVDLIDKVSPQDVSTGSVTVHRATFGQIGIAIHDLVGTFTEGDPEGRTYSEPLSHPEVRQALNYAVDREALSEALGLGLATPTSQSANPGNTDYDPALDTYYSYDPERARSLLAEAGYPDGFTLDMTVAGYYEGPETWAQAVAQYWSEIGVTANLNVARTIPIWVQEAQPAPAIAFGGWGSSGSVPFSAGLYYSFVNGTTYSPWRVGSEIEAMVAEQAIAPTEHMERIHKQMARYAVEQGFRVPLARLPGFFAYDPSKVDLHVEQDQANGVPIATRITPVQ